MTGILIKRGNVDTKTDSHRGKNDMKRHREKTAVCKPRREA